jgi:TATA-binding protein-associated factor
LDGGLFTKAAKASTSHNVDKPMMEGDLSLVTAELVMETRLAAAKAIASLRKYNLTEVSISRAICMARLNYHWLRELIYQNQDLRLIRSYLASPSAHQVYMAASIIVEWVNDSAASPMPDDITALLTQHFEKPLPATYSEMTVLLKRIQADCQALFTAFGAEGKVPKSRIPSIPPIDKFSLESAQIITAQHFDALASLLNQTAKKNVLPSLKDRQMRIMVSLGRYGLMKERYDTQVRGGIGGALVALKSLPVKIGPVVKAIMDSVKVSHLPDSFCHV